MYTYISLLRGINVGGNNKIKMDILSKLYEELGFNNIKTYIQSGNVVFDSIIDNSDELAVKIEEKIKSYLSLDIRVIIRAKEDFGKIIDNNPFNEKDL
ncbi:MAG: DUF1697 domain-containing protein, partial [Bacillota bacterium]|nr:DUF1697 domain-containing protein [Bacillota bacterium]